MTGPILLLIRNEAELVTGGNGGNGDEVVVVEVEVVGVEVVVVAEEAKLDSKWSNFRKNCPV